MNCMLAVNAFASELRNQIGQIAGLYLGTGKSQDVLSIVVFMPDADDTELIGREVIGSLQKAGISEHVRIKIIMLPEYSSEAILKKLVIEAEGKDLCIFPGNCFGDEISVRLAARIGGSSLTGVVSLRTESETSVIAVRKEYAGHMLTEYKMKEKPFCFAADHAAEGMQTYAGERSGLTADFAYDIEKEEFSDKLRLINKEPVTHDCGLMNAEFVVALGRGIGSRSNAEEACAIAEQIGANTAGTRPCVMNAWMPMESLLGVSGSLIAPEICILLGSSGAPAFYAGVKNSTYIIAVNNREDAPVMKKSDLAIQGDCMEVFRVFAEKFLERQ